MYFGIILLATSITMSLTSQVTWDNASAAGALQAAAAGQRANTVPDTTASTTIAEGGSTFVAPFYTDLASSITSVVNIVQQETVSIAYDDLYKITLTDAAGAAILGAFKLSGNGNTYDVSGRSVAAQAAFVDAMKTVLTDASLNAVGGTLQQNMYNDTFNDMKSVYGDLISNILQSNWYVNVSLDVPKGAKDLCNNLFTVAPTNKGYIQLMGDQIPNSNYMAYSDVSENLVTDTLPLLGGDSLVFVFNVDAKVNSYHTSERGILNAGKPGANTPAAGVASVLGGNASSNAAVNLAADAVTGEEYSNYAGNHAVSIKGKTSRVAFKITFSSSEGAGKPIHSILPNGTAVPATVPGPASGAAKWGLTVGDNGYAPAVLSNLIDPAQTGATVVPATASDPAALGPAPTPGM